MASEQMDVDGPEDRTRRATSVLSIDDIEAAQALEDLRSDQGHSQSPPQAASTSEPPRSEPLLSLLTSSHPLISTAINGSVSMYTTGKSYSPRFKSGAEFLERKIGPRVMSTAQTVGRLPGVEGGLRWALQRRESSSAAARNETSNNNNNNNSSDRHHQPNQAQQAQPARPNDDDEMDIEKGLPDTQSSRTRRSSSNFSTAETLPPYDTYSSPSYEELAAVDRKLQTNERSQKQTWKGRLMISTSGLGVAMSEESLRSLTYCLAWLRWANTRLGNAIIGLKRLLQEWEHSRRQQQQSPDYGREQRPRSPTILAQQIQQLKSEVLQTLKQVVDIVSKYAGGALPENARNLVRRHLTSLPRRFRIASTSSMASDPSVSQSDMATNAHRALVLAEEGLDMMVQVSNIVNDTLLSAEGWCERLRRPRPSTSNGMHDVNGAMPPPPGTAEKSVPGSSPTQTQDDVEMGGVEKA
ncbi:hypothetical protein VTO42DRAFT_2675 [Malbranchea cinnamomea]